MTNRIIVFIFSIFLLFSLSSCGKSINDSDYTANEIISNTESGNIKTSDNSVSASKKNSLNGKIWCSFGDSITSREMWQGYVVEELKITHINCGVSSTCLSGSEANAFWQDIRLQEIKNANADIVTILGGANDLTKNPVIGTAADIKSKDVSTFIGAYSYIIENLLTWKPSLEIIILGTTWAHNDGTDHSDVVTYSDFSNACKLVAEYYGLPFVDLHANLGFNEFTMGNNPYNVYSSDHIHPNELGAKKIANMVIAKMKEIYNY